MTNPGMIVACTTCQVNVLREVGNKKTPMCWHMGVFRLAAEYSALKNYADVPASVGADRAVRASGFFFVANS